MKEEPALACDGDGLLNGRPGDEGGGPLCVTFGLMFRNDLNPT